VGKKDYYCRQCKYQTVGPLPRKIGVSWIPETLARVGKCIYFGKKTDAPEELWEITEVGARKPVSWLVAHQMDWKHQREVSDV
jgi:hypothetical protein